MSPAQPLHPFQGAPESGDLGSHVAAPHRAELRQSNAAAVTGLVHRKLHWLPSRRNTTQSPQQPFMCTLAPALQCQQPGGRQRRRSSQVLFSPAAGETEAQYKPPANSQARLSRWPAFPFHCHYGPTRALNYVSASLPQVVVPLRAGSGGCLPD